MELNGCHVIAARSTHAVQAAMFVLELPAQIPTEIIQKASAHYDSSTALKEFFPIKSENRGMLINISESAFGINQTDGIQGITLQRNDAEGIPEFILGIQGNQLAFTCNKYTRWQDVSKKAIELLNEFSVFVCPVPGIAVIALQYVDEFLITGTLKEFRSSILFAQNNKRLPSSILEEKDFWHNHAGWFELSPKDDRVLNNLNVSYYPQQHDRNAVQIISAHKEILKAPVTEQDGLKALLPDSFEMLHSMNKAMFKEILNEETLQSINLS
jgi:uncharacterized protein (TIGR04255 family)